MKKALCFLCVLFLTVGLMSGCVLQDPKDALYENITAFTPQFDLWTWEVSETFTAVLSEHPELQVYIGQVKTSGSKLRQTVSVTYQHTDIPLRSIRVGREEEIAVPAFKAALDEVSALQVMVLRDCPAQPDPQVWLDQIAEEHYLSYMGLSDTNWTFYSNDFTEDTVVLCDIKYGLEPATLSDYREKCEVEVGRLAETLWNEGADDEARVLAIHDYLIKYANYVETDTPVDHTPYGILLEGRGVCDGYAYAAKLLLDAAGIENRIVTGKADGGDHRWNLVQLEGRWYHMDVTWDDPVSADGREHHTYDYYLKGDTTMSADHEWEGEYPTCAEDHK